jgi:hypothetical protein
MQMLSKKTFIKIRPFKKFLKVEKQYLIPDLNKINKNILIKSWRRYVRENYPIFGEN